MQFPSASNFIVPIDKFFFDSSQIFLRFDMATALNHILGGGPIVRFNSVEEPTYGDVLRFYSQFWGINKPDTSKETKVSSALKSFYTQRNIDTLNELTIRRKIHTQVLSLKKILKFKSKEKTQANIKMENIFKSQLSNIFQIKKSIPQSREVDDIVPMDVDDVSGDSVTAPGFNIDNNKKNQNFFGASDKYYVAHRSSSGIVQHLQK